MVEHSLTLPVRERKPRSRGRTMVIDNGVPNQFFVDMVESFGQYIDLVKFGWGTALVTQGLESKTALLKEHEIKYMFGGTLFEKHVMQDLFDEFRMLCRRFCCDYVEVSNGTIDLAHEEKTVFITKLASDFEVISEVGFKDHPRSELFAPNQWISCIERDLAAGAQSIILEARESGTSGICRPDGEIRFGLIEEIINAPGMDVNKLMFEAPNKAMQTYFIKRVGSDVNLGNVGVPDILALETLRLGLRADTLDLDS